MSPQEVYMRYPGTHLWSLSLLIRKLDITLLTFSTLILTKFCEVGIRILIFQVFKMWEGEISIIKFQSQFSSSDLSHSNAHTVSMVLSLVGVDASFSHLYEASRTSTEPWESLQVDWLPYLIGQWSKLQIHGCGLQIPSSLCQEFWALSRYPLMVTKVHIHISPQARVTDQAGRRPHLQSKCFLNPFQNLVVQSFQLMPGGCFLKKESASSALLVSDFKPCLSIWWF